MTDFFSTNTFDLAVYVCLFVAVVMGFMTGLLRGLATIFDYICGIGIAGGNAEGHLSPRELSENSNAADLDHIHCNFYSGVVL